ncbi:MAG: thioredoxin family protein [Pirellula sp.]|jgi:thioredoxin 1|nr:thioredoxin family protein [Pirellula sp.]
MAQSDSSSLLKFIAFLAIVAAAYVVFLRPGKQPESGPMKEPGPVVSNEEFQSAISNNPVTLVKFGATWCGPCVYMDEELEKLKSKNFAASVLHIDVDSNPELSSKYEASSIPKTILFKDGTEVDTKVGGMSAEEIEAWVASKTSGS